MIRSIAYRRYRSTAIPMATGWTMIASISRITPNSVSGSHEGQLGQDHGEDGRRDEPLGLLALDRRASTISDADRCQARR